ncbi:MAG: DegT/DnrJ/EryC1/StrS family aminotransferase [Vampirovibrionales bacterium]
MMIVASPTNTTIQMLNLVAQAETLQPQLDEAVQRVIHSGQYILGPDVTQFEQEVASYLGASHAIGVASGTDALYLALMALGIGSGDEVITTSMSYVATSEAIARTGATPVFIDIDPITFNLELSQLEQALSSKTKAVLPVHLFGQAVDMTTLIHFATRHGLRVIEDCAQAMGATWQGQAVGTFGDAGCYSFFPTKNLGAAGDGGLVTTQDKDLAEKILILRLHGQTQRYHHAMHGGINSRLDSIQAAILRVKLPHLEGWNQARRTLAKQYNQGLKALQGVVCPSMPEEEQAHVFHQYTLRITPKAKLSRDALQQALAEKGIASMIYYPVPLHHQGIHATLGYAEGSLPHAETIAKEVLSLPICPQLSETAVSYILETLQALLG